MEPWLIMSIGWDCSTCMSVVWRRMVCSVRWGIPLRPMWLGVTCNISTFIAERLSARQLIPHRISPICMYVSMYVCPNHYMRMRWPRPTYVVAWTRPLPDTQRAPAAMLHSPIDGYEQHESEKEEARSKCPRGDRISREEVLSVLLLGAWCASSKQPPAP